MTSIELLAPARNLACGKAAVDHGADAVYLGAPSFGARAAAGNSVEDIAELCSYAHRFGVRIYVTLNTILYDHELEEVERLTWRLHEAGVDALIVQDMALLGMHLPPIPLHASTQMDNRSAGQLRWLHQMGFSQAVLARECGVSEIAALHRAVPEMPLEAFVHGALCVSYSGRCQASQFCFGRSANRGQCAQFCRLPFDLEDKDGHKLMTHKHLLSLRDMDRHRHLEEMMDAGVRSFKIEGRLKDESYVRNITAFYRQQIDNVLRRRPEYVRSSWGRVELMFSPDPTRSFSRGFTDYFLHGRMPDMASIHTPKSLGKCVGTVKDVRPDCIVVAGTASFSNGDGLCFVGKDGELTGFRVNRAEGNRLYPAVMPQIPLRATLYRNADVQWDRLMSRPTARRTMGIQWTLSENADGFSLSAVREDGVSVEQSFPCSHTVARTPQTAQMEETLGRLGDTPYYSMGLHMRFSHDWFLPRSVLAEWRRTITGRLDGLPPVRQPQRTDVSPHPAPQGVEAFNVSNRLSRRLYQEMGCSRLAEALETAPARGHSQVLMTCRYCLRFQLGQCLRQRPPSQPLPEPLYLRSMDGRRFRLRFDCNQCQMTVVHED